MTAVDDEVRYRKIKTGFLATMLSDTSVLFRYYAGELPYIKAFLYHYVCLGAHQLVGIVQHDSDATSLSNAFDPYSSTSTRLYIIHARSKLTAYGSLRSVDVKSIPGIGEWTLNVDPDEFLFFKTAPDSDTNSISSLMPSCLDRININWVMSTNITESPALGAQWGTGKDYARSDSIIGMKNDHIFQTKLSNGADRNRRLEKSLPLGLAHHWGRTLKDTIIKIYYQRAKMPCPKNSDFADIQSFVGNQELPRRLRYMAFLDSLEGNIDISSTVHTSLYDYTAEDALIDVFASCKQVESLRNLYCEYRELARRHSSVVFKKQVGRSVNIACEELPSLGALRRL